MEVQVNKKEQFISCECQSEVLKLERWEDEEETYLTVYQYMSDRYSFWERLVSLFGGKVRTCDIVLSKENFDKLKKF